MLFFKLKKYSLSDVLFSYSPTISMFQIRTRLPETGLQERQGPHGGPAGCPTWNSGPGLHGLPG